ncbi:MAG: SDR family oxidoreductase [Pseudomonadota bacterium]
MDNVLITGANRGIGLELTRQFLAAGQRVFACCRTPEAAVELKLLNDEPLLSIHALDVTADASVAALAGLLGATHLDVLVNNAGIMGGDRQSVDDMDYGAWRDAFEVNTLAPFRLVAALLPMLRQAERPRVVTLSSQMGSLNRKSTGAHAYRSSKAAVNKVMQVLALELEADGIVVCPVHPGWVRTAMGGATAELSAEESAAGLVRLIDSLTPAHSGRFWTWEGKEHPW